MKVLVTGSRDVTDYQFVYDQLDQLWLLGEPMLVIHGNARGADSFADAWAVYRENVSVVRVPALWDKDGKASGPIRNSRMLELQPDIVLAFFQEGAANKGTSHMAALAESKGYEVRRFVVK